jgi:hypothetical protein
LRCQVFTVWSAAASIFWSSWTFDQVGLPCGFSVAVLGGESEPSIGCGQFLRHANPVLGEDAEIVLAVGETVCGGRAIPLCGEHVIGLVAGARADGEIVHHLHVALH